MSVVIGALKETEKEKRVALTPEVVKRLVKRKYSVFIENGAGRKAFLPDRAYEAAGAKIVTREEVIRRSDVIAVINRPDEETLTQFKNGQVMIGLLSLLVNPDSVKKLVKQKITSLSFELLPRTLSRAQTMDALSSQAAALGYKAVLMAADHFSRYLPMMITAAGTAKPAKVLVLGTGIAGLQAIATAKRLGAIVSGYDIRPTSRGEVESLGAIFLTSSVSAEGRGGYARALTPQEQAKQQRELADFIGQNDIIITTARVPGRKPPLLVTQTCIADAAPGTIFVDLGASELGGNVAGSQPDRILSNENGVQIIGAGNAAAQLPNAASSMYARNVQAVLDNIIKDGALRLDLHDDVLSELTATHDGTVVSNRLRQAMHLPIRQPAEQEKVTPDQPTK
ncbi:MAG: NAD(P) transhydrogenase subunit alpha [Sporolactobacillus sp.]|jgi:NAD(P) transhydrogenase subunit alpha|nr:NAD(P) transhydrogenase subunit alpha [Sporolactobacillus sp.]